MLRYLVSFAWIGMGAAYICGGMSEPSLGDVAGLVCFALSSLAVIEK